jgi:hypothetical protein
VKARDTDDDAHAAQIAALRALGTVGRADLCVELSETVREQTLIGIRRRNPEFDEHQVRHEMLRIFYGSELADRVAVSNNR